MKPCIVVISNNDWNEFWYQRQQFAFEFAKRGYMVYFLNKTLTRFPNIKSFLRGNYFKNNRGYLKNDVPDGTAILTPLWLPPCAMLRPINRLFIKRTLKLIKEESKIVISYTPTYNTLDFIQLAKPIKNIYVNVHNYEAKNVMKDLLRSEIELINSADYLFADSVSNQNRLRKKLKDINSDVKLSPPGVDLDAFSKAQRGDEQNRPISICYYGGIGLHLDFDLYNELSKEYKVVFIGKASSEAMALLSDRIEVLPPMPNKLLGGHLRDYDILAIFYKNNDYINAVIPAKIFECMATQKPLLISGLNEVLRFSDVVNDVNGSVHEAKRIIQNLHTTETPEKKQRRIEYAENASWERRFDDFMKNIEL